MTFQPFDVVVVPFPYSDRLAEKRRPALVVSHPDLSARLGRLWVAMITSTPHDQIGDVALQDFQAAGLPVASTIRASKIATLDVERVLRRAGRLSDHEQKLARRALLDCAGF
jgi:mRNA interferase MazF